jgi:hypothetical protein
MFVILNMQSSVINTVLRLDQYDTSVRGIAQWCSAGLRAGWSRVRVPAGAGNFSFHHRVQTGSGTRPTSYPMGSRGSFPGGKAAGAWSWPLTSINTEVKNAWIYNSTPQYVFMAWCLVKHRDSITFHVPRYNSNRTVSTDLTRPWRYFTYYTKNSYNESCFFFEDLSRQTIPEPRTKWC